MDADVSRWMYVMIGRLLYEVGELDGWQVGVYEIPGVFVMGGTGTGCTATHGDSRRLTATHGDALRLAHRELQRTSVKSVSVREFP